MSTTNISTKQDHEKQLVMPAPSWLRPEHKKSGKRVYIHPKPQILKKQTQQPQLTEIIVTVLKYISIILLEICIIFILGYVIYICSINFNITAAHALLVTFGFMFCLTQGSLVFSNENIIMEKLRRNTKRAIHFGIQIFGGIIGISGIVLQMYKFGFDDSKPHVLFGLTALIAYIYSAVIGIIYYFDTSYYNRLARSNRKKLGHIIGNIVTLVTIYGALLLVYNSAFVMNRVDPSMMILLKIITVMSLALSVFISIHSIYNAIM